jgi:hypothetical protein
MFLQHHWTTWFFAGLMVYFAITLGYIWRTRK